MELFKLISAFVGGAAIGVVYFGGLWLTVNRIPTTQTPGILIIISFLVRTFIMMVGFFLLFSWAGYYALPSFIGILIVRFIMINKVQPNRSVKGTRHVIKS